MNKVFRLVTDRQYRFNVLTAKGVLNFLPDRFFLMIKCKLNSERAFDLNAPKTFNEKLQWLKLYDRKPIYTTMVDKYSVRKYIADQIGAEYLIPLVGGPWKHFDEIDFNALPEQFVLKCTHDSGGLVICRDKAKLDKMGAKRRLTRCLARNYYWHSREWPYKNVPPHIIAEQYMEDSPTDFLGEEACKERRGLTDYKFFCFGGEPKFLYVSIGLENHATAQMSFYDLEGKKLPFHRRDYKPMSGDLILPENYAHMMEIARQLARVVNSPFVRIDLYSIRGKTYFSEITFSPCGGMIPFSPMEWDDRLGDMLELPATDQI